MATIADIRRGDLFTRHATGATHIAVQDARPLGDRGEAAHLTVVAAFDRARVARREDGVFEAGSIVARKDWLASDEQVTILERGVAYHWHVEDEAAWADNDANRDRAEVARVVAVRREQERNLEEMDAEFRLRVRRAITSGVSVAELTEMTGLSRARIYQIRDGRR